jgi:hypothetical protein
MPSIRERGTGVYTVVRAQRERARYAANHPVALQPGTYLIPYFESFERKVLRLSPSMPAACD